MWYEWLIFALFIILIPLGVAWLLSEGEKRTKPTETQRKNAYKNAFRLILFYWLCDLFYMSFILDNNVCKFVFGGLTMLIIMLNLSTAFIGQANKNDYVLGKWGLLQDFIFGVGISVYLIYIISNPTLQTIVLAITASIYGGMLTLVGVAWTIKNNNKDKQEGHKNLVIPYLTISANKQDVSALIRSADILWEFCQGHNIDTPMFCYDIENVTVRVSQNADCIPIGATINNKLYKFTQRIFVERGNSFLLKLTDNHMINTKEQPSNIYLLAADVLDNYYKYKCQYIMETTYGNTGVKSLNYRITALGLPINVNKEDYE